MWQGSKHPIFPVWTTQNPRLTFQGARYVVLVWTNPLHLGTPPPSGCFLHLLHHHHQIHRARTWGWHMRDTRCWRMMLRCRFPNSAHLTEMHFTLNHGGFCGVVTLKFVLGQWQSKKKKNKDFVWPTACLMSLPPSISVAPVIEECRLPSVVTKVAIGVLGCVPATCIWEVKEWMNITVEEERFHTFRVVSGI